MPPTVLISFFLSLLIYFSCWRKSNLIQLPKSVIPIEPEQYGGADVNTVKENKALKEENAKLKKLVADLSLDKVALKELLEGKW